MYQLTYTYMYMCTCTQHIYRHIYIRNVKFHMLWVVQGLISEKICDLLFHFFKSAHGEQRLSHFPARSYWWSVPLGGSHSHP
jgi:hypothetical protein